MKLFYILYFSIFSFFGVNSIVCQEGVKSNKPNYYPVSMLESMDECNDLDLTGRNGFDGTFIIHTSDGGSLIGGNYTFVGEDIDGVIMKNDANNNIVWDNGVFPRVGIDSQKDFIFDAIEVSDGYVMVGSTDQDVSSDSTIQLWATKYSFEGNHTWTYIFPTDVVAGFEFSKGLSVENTYGDRILIGGYVQSENSFTTRAQLWALNQDGTLFDRIAGATDNDVIEKVIRSSDGNYFAFGTTWDDNEIYSCFQNGIFFTIIEKHLKVWKLNTSINQIWSKDIDFQTGDIFVDAIQTNNGFGLLGVNDCGNNKFILGSFNNDGNELWQKTIVENLIDAPTVPTITPFGLSVSCDNSIVVGISTFAFSGNTLSLEYHKSSSVIGQDLDIGFGRFYSVLSKNSSDSFLCLGRELSLFGSESLCTFDDSSCGTTNPSSCNIYSENFDIEPDGVFPSSSNPFWDHLYIGDQNHVYRSYSGRVSPRDNDFDCSNGLVGKALLMTHSTPSPDDYISEPQLVNKVNLIGEQSCYKVSINPASVNHTDGRGVGFKISFLENWNGPIPLGPDRANPNVNRALTVEYEGIILKVNSTVVTSDLYWRQATRGEDFADIEFTFDKNAKTVDINFPDLDYSYSTALLGSGNIEGVLYETTLMRESYAIDCICASNCSGDGPSDFTIDVGDDCGSQGQTVSIPVSVRNFSQLTSLDVELELSNPSVGQITGIRSSNALSNLGGSVLAPDKARVNWFSGPNVDLNDNTIIFYIDIRLIGAVDSQSEIVVTSSSAEVGTGGTLFTPTSTNGTICVENSEISICGQITKPDGTGVQNVQVSLTGNSSQATTTDSNGNYCFEGLQSGEDYLITPIKDDDHKNGLTAGDLSRIQRHILGIRDDLDTPYKLIAGDVNLSKSLSGGDLSRIQRVILELDPRFLLVDSWKFVDKSYQFPDPLNPQTPDFPETILISDANNDQTSIDFIAIKMGDVNDSNSGQKTENQLDSKLATIKFNFEDKAVTQEEEFVSNISVEGWTNITSANTSFQWDNTKFEFIDVVDLNSNLSLDPILNFQKNKVSEGKLGFLWFRGAGATLQSNSKVFGIKFKAIGSARSSSEFKLAASPIAQEFEDLDNLLTVVEAPGTLTIQSQPDQLSVSGTTLNVGSETGQATFTVNSNTNWTATKTVPWFWLSPESSSGNGTVQVNYQENTSTSNRSATITVDAGGGLTRTVTITQSGAIPPPFITVEPTNLNFDSNRDSHTITVSSNITWIASDDAAWISISPASGTNNGSITITAQNNNLTSNRTARITLRGNDVPEVIININQSGSIPSPFMTVNPTNLNFEAAGGNEAVNISSNVSWSAIDDASWLLFSPASGSDNGSLNITCEQNNSTSSRSASITISGGGVSSKVINITQEAVQSISLSVNPSTVNVSSDAGQTSFNINSNANWTVNKTSPWFYLTPGSGSGNGGVVINYEENTSMQERTGTITVSSNGISRTVTIRQAANSFLSINPNSINASNGSGIHNINVTSNVSWSVSEDASWITVSNGSGSNNGTFTVSYDDNPTLQPRVADVIVSGTGVSVQTLRVTQAASTAAILISPSIRTVSNNSGELIIEVFANVDWNINSIPNWIDLSSTNGSNNGFVVLDYDRNPSTNDRTASIRFEGVGANVEILNITQRGGTIPSNDNCSDKLNISHLFGGPNEVPQVSGVFDNTYASDPNGDPNYGVDCFYDENINNSLWYQFTGDGYRYKIRSVKCDAEDYITSGDTQMSIYKSSSCANLIPAYCNDNFDLDNDLLFSNIEIPTVEGQQYSLLIDGCFCYEDNNGIPFASFGEFCIEVTKLGSSGTESISNSENIKFYPNPASNEVTIEFDLPNEKVNQISLLNVTGKVTSIQKVENLNRGKLKLKVRNQPNGIYHLVINTDKGVFTDKLILQR